jgi:hypothetical protein
MQFQQTTGLRLSKQQQKRQKQIYRNFFSLAGGGMSWFHCISFTPFSIAHSLSGLQNGPGWQLESILLRDHKAFHGYYIPIEPGWKFVAAEPEPFKCAKCEGKHKCEVIGPCNVCAECDSRVIKISEAKRLSALSSAVGARPPESVPTVAPTKMTPPTTPAEPAQTGVRTTLAGFFNGDLELKRQQLGLQL